MATFTLEERDALYALFTIDEHEVREGAVNKTSGKITWFTYVRREAIQKRLDNLFFGEWELYFLNPQVPAIYHAKHVDCSMGLIIRGIRREFNGSQDGGGTMGAKGAATDAFKRVTSMWGVGLYLQDSPTIRTDGYKKADDTIDWQKKDKMEENAMLQVEKWLREIGAKGNGLSPAYQEQNPATTPLDPEFHGLGNEGTLKPIHANILNAVRVLVLGIYDNAPHANKSLEALERNGVIHGDMAAPEIAGAVFVHRAMKDFGLEENEVCQILGKHPKDLIQKADSFKAAFGKVKKAAQEIKA